MDRPGVQQVPEGSGEQGKMEKTGCKNICCAPMTLAFKGLMMMMMMTCGRASVDCKTPKSPQNFIRHQSTVLMSVGCRKPAAYTKSPCFANWISIFNYSLTRIACWLERRTCD